MIATQTVMRASLDSHAWLATGMIAKRLLGVLWAMALLVPATASSLATAAEKLPGGTAVRVVVDPRVELVSIIFRLAGNPEYGRGQVRSYTRDVDEHFASFKDHAVVEIARKLRRTRGIGYDAPMALAVHLTDAEKLQTLVPLDPWPESLDRRWTPHAVREFLEAARRFVRDTSFRDFLEKHRALYEAAEARMQDLLNKEGHLEWFPEFFGQRPGASFTVVLGMLNGGNCYGPHCRTADGKEELYCILGVWATDWSGQPRFDAGMLGTVVHEFCHSYANAVVDQHAAEFKEAGEKLFSYVAPSMRSQAYGNWKTMLYESLVRACVVRYTRRYGGEAAARRAIAEETRRKFLWVGELSDLLGEYEAHRDQYPTLAAFSPRIVKFFNDYAEKFAKEQEALNARRPKVLSMIPANGAKDVDPHLTQIRVVFDRPMQDGSWSMVGGGEHFPEVAGKPAYDAKRTTWIVPVKLKPDWEYRLMLNSDRFTSFRSREGVPLAPVRVMFKTASPKVPSPPAPLPKRERGASLEPLPKRERGGLSNPLAPAKLAPDRSRHALLFFGHPGDAENEAIFAAVLKGLCDGLTGRFRFPKDQVLVWHGVKREDEKVPANCKYQGPATREAVQAGVKAVADRLKSEDTLWVIVVAHAHYDGRRAMLNLPGPDLDVDQFGKLFEHVAAGQQVFFITTPVSGFAIKSLSRKGRVVITATEADREVNATVYPIALADVLSNPPSFADLDQDKDGRVTLFDLYLTVSRRVLRAYADAKDIPTEHAQLDDNGDGRGVEVQLDYLEAELGGRAKGPARPPIRPGADGALAATIDLSPFFSGVGHVSNVPPQGRLGLRPDRVRVGTESQPTQPGHVGNVPHRTPKGTPDESAANQQHRQSP